MRSLMTILVTALILIASGCGTTSAERALSGGGIGAGIGAAAGVVTGGSAVTGAIVGGAAGAATGALTDEDDINLDDD